MRLMMPFARRISAGTATSTGGTTSTLIDTATLLQSDGFWSGQWVYMTASDEVRQIIDYQRATWKATLEYPLAATAAAKAYEIHAVFNALEIHEAINQAIKSSYPSFFQTLEDESLVICEDTLHYDLSGISPAVGIVHGVALERPVTRIYATVTGTSFVPPSTWTITLLGTDLSDVVATNWHFSIYDGSGKGLEEVITNVAADSIQFSNTNASAIPGTGGKCMLWDTTDQQLGWYPLKNVHFDAKQWPSNLRLYAPIYAYRGSRLRIKYSTMPLTLSTEAGTTVVPQEYLIPKAISILCKTRVGDNRVDRQRYAMLAEEYDKEAETYKKNNFFRLPDTELWMEGRDIANELIQDPQGDPLNWR